MFFSNTQENWHKFATIRCTFLSIVSSFYEIALIVNSFTFLLKNYLKKTFQLSNFYGFKQ